VKGLIVDVIEPLAMLALIGLVLVCRCRGSHKGFPDLCRHRGGADSSRRLNNAIVAWTDLQDLATCGRLASVMWVPTVAAWKLDWNRWCPVPWRSIDVSATVLAVAGSVANAAHLLDRCPARGVPDRADAAVGGRASMKSWWKDRPRPHQDYAFGSQQVFVESTDPIHPSSDQDSAS
jgi:hypothetical protein